MAQTLEDAFPGWSTAEIIQGYKDEDKELNKEKKINMKNLEKYEDIESSDKNVKSTEDISSHPDYWKKQDEDFGVIETDEGRKWGSLNEEGKFIYDEEVVDDKDEIVVDDKKIEVDGGEALNTIVKNDLENLIIPKKKPKRGLAKFTETVGKAFENIATKLPKKIEEVWSDKDKRRNVLRGLEIINASSGIKSIGQAKSPLGMISEGLLKAEKKFTAEDIAWYKAQNPEKKILSAKDTALAKLYNTYSDEYQKGKSDVAVDTRYNEVYKLAQLGKEPPTGILESTFAGLEKILSEVGMLERANKLIGRNKDTTEFSDEDLIEFKEIVNAATFSQIVGEAKKLYPVSNKDLELLKKTIGDVSTSPQAFRAMVAAQKALSEIGKVAHNKSFDIAFEGEGQANFRELSQEAAATELAETMKDKVNPETYLKLFGTEEPTSPFQVINAFYYQKLEPVYKKMEGEGGYFETFKAKEKKDTENILTLIKDRQLEDNKKKE